MLDSNLRDFIAILRRDGVVRHADVTLTPLTGGVSSEIYRVEDGGETFVIKRALGKLRVQDDWFADVGRNRYEQLYLNYVARFLPEAVPAVRDSRPNDGYFAMEYLGPEHVNWKQLLLAGDCRHEHAALAGRVLGAIHRHSAGDPEAARLFESTPNFHQLRLEPYLLATGQRHPDLRPLFDAEARRLAAARDCLVHGDFSPKNMLIRGSRLVLLDCEVAWYGDGAFDAAFLLTHLLLKALHHAPRERGLAVMAQTFWQQYGLSLENALDATTLERRVGRLVLMLLLARVDGKSPVEYLSAEPRKRFVREFIHAQLPAETFSLAALFHSWFSSLETVSKRGQDP